MLYYITNSFNDQKVKFVDIIFIDKSNAFDSIPHVKLIDKLKKLGIIGCFLSLITSFLDNRRQYVSYNSVKSCLLDVTSGTPQGSVLSPTIFNLFVHDLP